VKFTDFFRHATGGLAPYRWQRAAAEDGPHDVVAISTGMGKTEGAVLPWAWRLLVLADSAEPRHLVYCLPMRVLVQQTAERLRACFERLGKARSDLAVPVFTLMGGDLDEQWAGLPDRPWVLVGTQDQLLSRALNRGYAMSRYDWPVHFGLLNNDCRWIVDEVQLMGPGLWTTAQLDWMRRARFGTQAPSQTTWMSATVEPGFLDTTDRRGDRLHRAEKTLAMDWEDVADLEQEAVGEFQRRRDAVRPVEVVAPQRSEKLASEIINAHRPGTLSLVMCNAVAAARAIFEQLSPASPRVLLTSRFRGEDRAASEQALYKFEARRRAAEAAAVLDHPGLICVSTQVIEAGIDVSAHRLWSELAPWPSVVQRLGRLNRDGRDPEPLATFWASADGTSSKDRVGPYPKEHVQTAEKLTKALASLPQSLPASQALPRWRPVQRVNDFVPRCVLPTRRCPARLTSTGYSRPIRTSTEASRTSAGSYGTSTPTRT
jgi:CRISPR-associated endonuclease/helicase Cas3